MVRSHIAIALLVTNLVVCSSLACTAQASAENPDHLYKFEGTVANAETGRPIARALVQLFTETHQAVLTNAEGEFSFGKLPNGTVMVRVEKPGFFDPGARAQGFPLRTIVIGPESGKVILKLEPEGSIAGEVVDGQGEPIENATVEALTTQIVDGRRDLVLSRSNVTTDEDGHFRMAGLPPGKYFVCVRAAGLSRRILGAPSKGPVQSYPLIVYFPGVADIAAATPINLGPGQHGQAEFTLPLSPAFKISGTVTGIGDFKQVSSPMIVDAMQRPLLNSIRWDSQTGAFEFRPLPAGRYTLHIFAMIDENRPALTKQMITLNHDLTGFNVALRSGITIPVSVRTEFNKPRQNNCQGSFMSDDGKALDCNQFPAMVTLIAEPNQLVSSARPDGTDPSTFSLHDVPPGKYMVHVSPVVDGYVRSVRSGVTDLLQEGLLVPASGGVPPIEIVLRDDGAKVKVHVEADRIPEHARILLLPDFAPYDRPVSLDVPAGGDREYGNLAPGDYRVLAFESLDSVEYGNPDVLEKYAAKTAHITLSAQGTTTVTVELIREGE